MKRVHKVNWTETENKLLQEYYFTVSENTLRHIIPDKTLTEMQRQVAFLQRKNRPFKR